MSSTQSLVHDLGMPKLGAEVEGPKSPAPTEHEERNEPKPTTPKAQKFTLKLKEDEDFKLEATLKHKFKNGAEASFSLWYPMEALTTKGGERLSTLGKARLDEMKAVREEVYITTGNGSAVAAKFQGAHAPGPIKRGPTCTIQVVWDLALATPEQHEPKPKRKAVKRKGDSPESEPERKAPKVGPKGGFQVPDNVLCCIYLSMDDFLTAKPSREKIARRMHKITGHLAHLLPRDMDETFFITAILDPLMYSYLKELFIEDQDTTALAMSGFSLLASPFSPKKLDLVEVRTLLQDNVFTNGENFSFVLGYHNANVINEKLPDLAFGDNKRALECAARTQSPAPSAPEHEFIVVSDDSESESDDESDDESDSSC